jgi:hypothetical protein
VKVVAILGALICVGAAFGPPPESAVRWLAVGLGLLLGGVLWTLSDLAQSARSPQMDTAAMMQQFMLRAQMERGGKPKGPPASPEA